MITFIVFGASGDLASKKTFPSLWGLYLNGKLPQDFNIVGYSRSKITKNDVVERFRPYIQNLSGNEQKFDQFFNIIHYVIGDYGGGIGMENLNSLLKRLEETDEKPVNRVYYLTLPPTVYETVCSTIKTYLYNSNKNIGWDKIIIEKPFGTNLKTSNILSSHLKSLFPEDVIYRIDHYLGKEMVQNLLVLRFGNHIFEPLWNKDHIKCVLISFKEDIGTFGRGGYYDKSGVIRDFFQNHIMQLLSLVAMELPKSLHSCDVIDEKVKILKCVKPIDPKNVILGQYEGSQSASKDSDSFLGYRDDPAVPNDSNTATFASMVLYIDNQRWAGVPFIIKSGKALDTRKGEIRIQFKDLDLNLFENLAGNGSQIPRNELVVRLQPNEAIYLKFQCKVPGLGFHITTTELDLTIHDRFNEAKFYDAYEKLILDVINGSHINFVRSDELEESWKLFTPLLDLADSGILPVYSYEYGSRGPKEADNLALKHGFLFDSKYSWSK